MTFRNPHFRHRGSHKRFDPFNLMFMLIGAIVVIGIIASVMIGAYNYFFSKSMAETSLANFEQEQAIAFQGKSCLMDTDGDGYASCTVRDPRGERIVLQCSASLMQHFVGSASCKEIFVGKFQGTGANRGALR